MLQEQAQRKSFQQLENMACGKFLNYGKVNFLFILFFGIFRLSV